MEFGPHHYESSVQLRESQLKREGLVWFNALDKNADSQSKSWGSMNKFTEVRSKSCRSPNWPGREEGH